MRIGSTSFLAAVGLCAAACHLPAWADGTVCAPPGMSLTTAQLQLHAAIKADRPRRDPAHYLAAEMRQKHLSAFADGATYFVPKSVLDWRGRDWLGYDDNSQFVMPKARADMLLAKANGDVRVLEAELGIPPGSWAGAVLLRIDIPAPHELNLRLPSGNEAGANECWLPGGMTPFGHPEAVVDRIPFGKYVESPAWTPLLPEPTTGSSTSAAAASSSCCAAALQSTSSAPN